MDRNTTVSSKTTSLWKIELLGPLCVRRDEIVYTRFRTHKTGALLAYLATYPERTLRREELIDLFWPHYDLESGRNCLRIALSALRRLFHPDDNEDPRSPACVLADRDHVRLNPVTFTTDKADFEKCLLHATHAEDINARVEWLKKCLNIYQNNLLPGYDDDWIAGERQRLADQRLLAMRRLVALLVKLQDIPTALDYAHRSVELDPLREESHRMLMQLYIGMGQSDSALRQFQQLERLLDEQMGMQPTNITRALIIHPNNQIIYRDETQPIGKTDTNAAAHLIPQAVPPSRLPLPITPIFGQADTIARIVEMLQTPQTRLVTLTGLGGTGKTRLAFAVAEKMQDEFEDAVWFVSLAHVSEPHQILYEITRSMGLSIEGNDPILKQLADCLGKKPALFLLDSFDHMVGRGNTIIASLLDALPAAVCLVTSRQRLNISGEYEFAVEPLPTPITTGTPERLMEFASIQLFVNSARAVRSHFQINRDNAPAIANLCHHPDRPSKIF